MSVLFAKHGAVCTYEEETELVLGKVLPDRMPTKVVVGPLCDLGCQDAGVVANLGLLGGRAGQDGLALVRSVLKCLVEEHRAGICWRLDAKSLLSLQQLVRWCPAKRC